MQFVFAPIWGRLSDRIGRRPLMLMTIAGTSVALLATALAPSLAWLFAARLLGGVFAANISVASAYITDATDESERTRFMGLLGASFAVGRGICQPSMMSLASSFAAPEMRGAVMGAFTSRASLARVVGPLPAGFLFDRSHGAPFWLAAPVLLAMLALCSGFPERVGREIE